MLGQMEVAAALLLQPYLPKGAISVGTEINVAHVSPATVGQTVRATAVFKGTRRGGRRFVFAVEAKVKSKTIGHGTVERAVVDPAGFSARATPEKRRAPGA